MSAESLYNSILTGAMSVEALESGDISSLFAYMCERIEKGQEADGSILSYCESRMNAPATSEAREIIEKTYKRIYRKNGRVLHKRILRRILIAALAVMTFIVSSFFTAYALEIDMVESVKIVLSDKESYPITFVNYGRLNIYGKPRAARFETIDKLFEKELPNAVYPTRFPEGVEPYKVTRMPTGADDLFQVQIRADDDKSWVIIAKDAHSAYLPNGYIYTAEIGDRTIDYVYTVSRKGNAVTKYSVYTVYDDILYTFICHTGNWEYVKIMLDSVYLP